MRSLLLLLALSAALTQGYVYERCELARELLNTYGFPRSELGDYLIDNDISDDVACADIIYARHGFSAWYGWLNHCQGTNTESYVADCGV
ncbi:lysozyme C [Hyalella azteca]|uniref:lysozyme n=1 Tax=Hyalella azteca TaxID=294128 RepID=A0A8B7P455_HYAAZ|nr:lysozyme C [Hyalella azteca]